MTAGTRATATATPRWGMTIDLNRCVGCQTCTIACKHANDTVPGVQWRRVIDVETGTFPDVERVFMVTGCQHCEDPPCVPVCPTGATRKRDDGIVTMNYDVCIGCASCAVACPYQARTVVRAARGYYGEERTLQEKATAHPERLGVAQKCTFCSNRVDAGRARGLKPGVDPEATPACSAACIAQAIQFGDFNDPKSNVATLARENEHFQMHAELGTNPQIKYLYTTPAVPGRSLSAGETADDRLGDPANPLVGALQTFWDWRAAMNWMFGGASSGLAVLAGIGTYAGLIAPGRLAGLFMIAAVLMAIGLACVFMKIGRPFRFWRAMSRPQTSWMTRELYAVIVFYPAVFLMAIGWGGPITAGVATLAAGAFLVCQAQILNRARGIPAWRAPLIPAMIVATGLAEGFGVLILVHAKAATPLIVGTGVLLAVVNGLLWRRYVDTARAEGIGPLARGVLGSLSPVLHAIGHALPLVAFLAAYGVTDFSAGLLDVAGIALVAGGMLWKFIVVTRASYQQGFALPRAPQRGSGLRAAPPRLEGSNVRPT